MTRTVFDYCENNVLVTPSALFSMKDVCTLMHAGESTIFYKALEQDLLDVEFLTQSPCLVYIEHGRETITAHNNTTYTLSPGSAALLPAGLLLHSNYANTDGLLKAYLVFFGKDVITHFLRNQHKRSSPSRQGEGVCAIDGTESLNDFFRSIQRTASQGVASAEFLNVKLLELLHLLSFQNQEGFYSCLAAKGKATTGKRNIRRLLEDKQTLRLTVSDLAHLSGRSLSSFNRDFKAQFGMPPKQWLINQRMLVAHQRLRSSTASVGDIALELGYENNSHFIKLFKSRYGMTPTELRG